MITRRAFVRLSSLAIAGSVAGCHASSGDTSPAAGSEQPSGAGSFPAEVVHKYGTTTVPQPPPRVVVVGLTEQDVLLALGVKPIAVTEWYGEQPYATWPWAQPALGDAQPEVLDSTDGPPLEKIGALRPDLIIGTNAGLDEAAYKNLSRIAPTVANSGSYDSDYFEPWPTQTVQIGEAVGKKTEAEALVSDIQRKSAEAAAANPQLKGKKAIFLQAPFYEGRAIAYQAGLSTDFLTDLGFVVPPEIDPYATDGGQAYIPLEKLDVLNAADVLIWATEDDAAKGELEKNQLFNRLRAVQDGRSLYTGGELAGAIYFTTVLSLPYVLDELVPMLIKAFPAQ